MRFGKPAPDVYTASTDLGPVRWLGLPFALASLMPLSGAVGLVEVNMEGGGEAPALFLLLFATPFLCVGLGLLFWKSEVTVDLRAGRVARRAGVFVPFRTRTRKLEGYVTAVHERRVIQGQKSSRTVYPVSLETRGGGAFELMHCRKKHAARALAEWLARHAELAIVDRTSGVDQRREFADLDTSLRDRRADGEPAVDPAPPPAKMRSRLDAADGRVTVQIPAHGVQPLIVVGMMFAMAPIGMAALFLIVGTDGDNPAWFTGGLFGTSSLLTLGAWVAMLHHALRRYTLVVDGDALVVEQHGLLRRRTVMPADEVEDLYIDDGAGKVDTFLGGGPPITALSDRAEATFGQTLKRAESTYLTAVLRGALSA